MISFITVTCPHCGISGQIVMPPAGSVIVGPCPRCSQPVVLFHGWVLPLEKGVMESGKVGDIRQHVKEVLSKFITERVDRLFDHMETERRREADTRGDRTEVRKQAETEPFRRFIASQLRHRMSRESQKQKAGKITDQEFQQFVEEELNKIDDNEYFRSIFG